MSEDEIMALTLEEVIAKLAELDADETALDDEVDASEDEERISQATTEKRALLVSKKELLARKAELEEIETRKKEAELIANDKVDAKVVETFVEKVEERKMYDRTTKEYRDAFLAMLAGKATVEQRTIFADNTVAGDGASLPIGLDNEIWDQIYTNHPILEDIDRQAFGVAIKVSQATPAGTSKKKDSDTVSEMSITFNDVTLAGNDYLAVVKLSYAEAKMSAGAMERYLAKAVVDQIGEAMAKDVFARILSDASANSVTKGTTYFESIGVALGKAKLANNPVIYAPSDLYYAILKEVDSNGQPIVREGIVLGAELKKDNAATKITIVDPKEFVLDEIAGVTLKIQDKVEEGCFVYGGYARAEGCLRKTNAAAFIA